jgi:hypothetical protein
MNDDQCRALEAMGFRPENADRYIRVPEARRRAARALRLEMPREIAPGVLEMLRMCWAKSEPWDYDLQDQLAWWIWERYPDLFAESLSGCSVLVIEPGLPQLPGWQPESDREHYRRREQEGQRIRESWDRNRRSPRSTPRFPAS